MEDDPRNFKVPAPGRVFFAGWIVAIVLALVAPAGLVLAREYWIGRQLADLEREHQAGPHVLVTNVTHSPPTRYMKLPASIRGFDETDLYAKVAGYLKELKVDKGDRVRKGQVIAILQSPELDQQVANARANYELAMVTDRRNQTLRREGVVPPQTADESPSPLLQAKAVLNQQIAHQPYATVTPPFAGIVTSRNADPPQPQPTAT